MKKELIKGLTCLGLAGIMLGGVVGLAGCNSEKEEKTYGTGSRYIFAHTVEKDMFIKIDDVLHRGNVIIYHGDKAGFGLTGFKFNCGQYLISSEFRAYRNEPEKETYEHKCEVCFESQN